MGLVEAVELVLPLHGPGPAGRAGLAKSVASELLPLFVGWLLSRLRPGRFVTKYSHVMPRLSHREHVGFSLWHLTFERAHAWQLSRNLEVVEVFVGWRAGVGGHGVPMACGLELRPVMSRREDRIGPKVLV